MMSSLLTIGCIGTQHSLYRGEIELRVEVLRRPLGMARETVFFPFEEESLHFVATRGHEVIGCVLFHRESETSGRLFQMAVHPSAQGTGLGRALVDHLEQHVRELGVRTIELSARAGAIGFYEKLGYVIASGAYLEVGITHYKMRKTWRSGSDACTC